MNKLRSLAIALALALSLALPSAMFAANQTSVVTEGSITAAVSVSMTVPTSATYAVNAATKTATASIAITAVNTTWTTSQTDLDVTPGGNIDYAKRSMTIAQTGFTSSTNVPLGGWGSNSVKTIATKTSGDITGGSVTVTSSVYLPNPITYTGGTLTFSLTGN